MDNRTLPFPTGFDPHSQRQVGLFLAQLDDQLSLLREKVKNLTVAQLEWQPQPGVNTVGMLLAHIAIAEFFWIAVAVKEIPPEPDGDNMMKAQIGIHFDDDGLPLKPDATHPLTIKGKTAADYLEMIDRTRRIVHSELKNWRDGELDSTYLRGKRQVSRSWTLYHVLEHFSGHYGQILMLKHLMRAAGVLAEET